MGPAVQESMRTHALVLQAAIPASPLSTGSDIAIGAVLGLAAASMIAVVAVVATGVAGYPWVAAAWGGTGAVVGSFVGAMLSRRND